MYTKAIPTSQPWGKAEIQWWHAWMMIRCYGWTFSEDLQGTPRSANCCDGNGYVDRGTPGTTTSHLLSFPCAPPVFPGALFPLSLLFFSPLWALMLFLPSQVSTHLTTDLAFTLQMKFQGQISPSQCTAEPLWLSLDQETVLSKTSSLVNGTERAGNQTL